MNAWLSPQLLEACNGTLLAVLGFMLVGTLSYLLLEWREIGIFNLYSYRKAGIALSVFLIGLVMRTGVIWWVSHLRNHDLPDPFWAPAAPWLLSAGTVTVVVGGICWVRVTAWRELGHWFWFVAAVCAVGFGVWFAM